MPTAAPLVGSGADGQRRLLDGGRPVQRPVGQRASELPRIAFRECARNDTSDERGLRIRIRLTRRELDGAELGREPTLEMRVLASGVAVVTQVVAKRQGAAFLVAARLNDMHMVRMRPYGWPVEEGTERVVGMGHVDISQLAEPWRVGLDRVVCPA